ncbi:MAG: 50S ribosomal protein L24e [Candidatus Micrarchaeota archaeon]
MHPCYFCGNEIRKGTGMVYIKKDGVILYFCSSKCRKNSLNLKREGTKVKWTKTWKQMHSANG